MVIVKGESHSKEFRAVRHDPQLSTFPLRCQLFAQPAFYITRKDYVILLPKLSKGIQLNGN